MTHHTSIASRNRGAGFKPAPFFIVGFLFWLSCLFIAVPVLAEIPVVEIEDREAVTPVRAASASSPDARSSVSTAYPAQGGNRQSQLGDIFVQMQQLQHEVQELRGLVEQQAFEIQTLKQQGKDNYIDLDKRIGALQSNTLAPANSHMPMDSSSSGSAADVVPLSGAEKDNYDAAYKLLDQGRKDDAVNAFQKHVALYPGGKYAPNAYYWMGQIYLSQGQLEQAREQFVTLLKNFPEDRKAPDAQFALGKVYFQQGKKPEAKKLIQEVSQGNSSAAALAKTFLQDNF